LVGWERQPLLHALTEAPITPITIQELIQAVRDNDLERVIHMVWLRRANPYFAPFFLPPPIEAESKVGFVLTARAAAARSQRAQALGPPRRSLVETPMSALHWAAKTVRG